MILSAPKSEKYGIKLESLACFYAILDTCVYFLCVCVVPGCEQESQISRQRRTVVPSVPQNAEKEARSLFAKEVLSLLSSPVCVFSCFSGYRKIIQSNCVFVPCEQKVTHAGSGGLGPDPHALLFSIICWSAAPDPTLCADLFDSASRCTTPIGT